MIKVLTNDGLQQEAIDNLKLLGIEVTNYHYSKEELKNILKRMLSCGKNWIWLELQFIILQKLRQNLWLQYANLSIQLSMRRK